MVYIPEPGRGTLCISSQVGCAMDCSFCSTAQQGFNRNLTAAEIVNYYSEEELTRLFRDLGEEPAARRIASLIVKMRKKLVSRLSSRSG